MENKEITPEELLTPVTYDKNMSVKKSNDKIDFLE